MPQLSLLIKPASSICNLRCRYCFYHSVAENRQVKSYGIMSGKTLESLVRKALEYADGLCTFAFQGGEPTLAGLDFYKLLIELQKQYNIKKVQINNVIQTNGIDIDANWAEFLAENRFLTGISLDGTKEIHDAQRLDATGNGSYKKVMEAIGLFKRYGVEYNILSVVNSYVARHIGKIYGFFKKNGYKYLQFIPCIDPLGEKPGGYEYSLRPERYAHFLKTLFDLWYEDIVKHDVLINNKFMTKDSFISVRYFDNLAGMLMGYPPESCGMSGRCACYFVIEADGGVYPCDFYVTDEWRMGNILESGFDELRNTEAAKRFFEVSEHVDPECRECRWFALCRGGCRRDREPVNDGKPALNCYCRSFKEFFDYAGERLHRVASIFSSR